MDRVPTEDPDAQEEVQEMLRSGIAEMVQSTRSAVAVVLTLVKKMI